MPIRKNDAYIESEKYTATAGHIVKIRFGPRLYCQQFFAGKYMLTIKCEKRQKMYYVPYNSIKYIRGV